MNTNQSKLNESLDFLRGRLKKYKDKWIEGSRGSDTGIGHTFEEVVLEKAEDNLDIPDLKDLEIKSQRAYTGSKLTLFTKSPSYPLRANTYIRDNFGALDEEYPIKTIHTSFFGNRINSYKNIYGFKLEANEQDKKLYLRVYDTNGKQIHTDKEIYWLYSDLEDKLKHKIKNVGFIEAQTKKENGKEYFKYEKLTLLINPTLECFIKCINDGTIQFDIRIGVYRSGKYKGKPHDHGSGFRISKRDFHKLFEVVEIIEF